jgi:hypothetical protein
MLLFFITLIFLARLSLSVSKFILGNTFANIDTSTDSKINFDEHNTYIQNKTSTLIVKKN